MNKANRFRQRLLTQNDSYFQSTPKNIVDQNQLYFAPLTETSFHFTHQNQIFSRYSSAGKKALTENNQIEPFREISNFNLNGQRMKSFIKAKSAKIHIKSKNSNRQNQHPLQSIKNSKKFQSNFQILKKQIQELESLQILRAQSNESNLENNDRYFEKANKDVSLITCEQFYPKAISGQFASGKNISILEKKRQNIKKVLKNKKFRNYINPHKNIDNLLQKSNKQKQLSLRTQKTQHQEQKQRRIVSFISLSKTDQSLRQTVKTGENCWRKKQTPQIIKKYYRPQSCSVKRQSYKKKEKINLKTELINYISMNSLISQNSPRTKGKNLLSNIQVPSSGIGLIQNNSHKGINSNKLQSLNKNKELLILCI